MRQDILKAKLEKLENLRNSKNDPYPEKSRRTHEIQEVLDGFEKIKAEVFLVGRIKSLRPMGGSAFVHIEDESGKMQLFFNKNNVGAESYKLFSKNIEMGDFIQVSGKLFKTKTEEKTLQVKGWKILTKNIRPIPAEYYGVKDVEKVLRKRYLDLMMNPETREIFRKKSVFWQTVRTFLTKEGFLEVQTPVLESIPGGAEAEPFITHYNALDRDFYLRISLELHLKRLLVGGYEKVFEIGRVFRNEGISREHLQEFDHMEFYWAYADLETGMKKVEEMYKDLARAVLGEKMISFWEGAEIDWGGEWPRVDYFSEFKKETGIDLSTEVTVEDLRKKADELGIKYDKADGKGRLIDTIYKKTIRQKMIQPCFLVGHPIEVSPLAKRDPQNPKRVLRLQPIACKSELGNGFAELNDPLDQRQRFEEQMKLREAGDEEAQMLDEDFIEALEYGMPPAFGFGMSERLFAVFLGRSIRETVIFPPVRTIE
ncbi:MAG: lysine--tRNA ligase [Candidatus Moranbacteria bacterium]|nr:lysine--tRNA ligase [Candidatus Moranbacteria bacterium]